MSCETCCEMSSQYIAQLQYIIEDLLNEVYKRTEAELVINKQKYHVAAYRIDGRRKIYRIDFIEEADAE